MRGARKDSKGEVVPFVRGQRSSPSDKVNHPEVKGSPGVTRVVEVKRPYLDLLSYMSKAERCGQYLLDNDGQGRLGRLQKSAPASLTKTSDS